MIRCSLPASVFTLLFTVSPGAAQQAALQLKVPLEQPLNPKEAGYEYGVTAQGNQTFTVAVDQQGIDVVVKVLGPDGKQLAEMDNASEDNGTGGTETVRVVALTPGEYRIRVAPFERDDAKPATYRITLSELRELTRDERANLESEKEIAGLEEQWERAGDIRDLPTLTRILREDGFHMGPTAAATRDREQMRRNWEADIKRRAKLGLTREHTIAEHVIKAAGNTAVSTGRYLMTITGKEQGPSRVSGQFVHVWAKNEGGWKLVADYTFPFGRVPRPKTEAVKLDQSILSAYAGTYRDENTPTTITLSVEDGVLLAQWSNGVDTSPKLPLKPVNETTFVGMGNPNDEVTFVRSARGEVRELIIIGEGPASRALRVN